MKKILLFFCIFCISIAHAQIAYQPSDLVACDDDFDGIFCFDLSIQNYQVLGTQNPSDFTITYHASQADADAGVNVLPLTYCGSSGETLFVRLEAVANMAMFGTTSFQIIVNPLPVVPPSVEIDLFACDSSLNPDGIAIFDLSFNAQFIFGTQSQTEFTLGYFETEANANANTNPITNLTSYANTSANQAIYVRLENIQTSCFTVGFFYLFVDSPNYTLTPPTPLEVCAENEGETTVFDLTERASQITNGNSTIALRYFTSQEDLENYSPTNNTSIILPTNFTNTTNPQTIYIRAIPPSSGIFSCATDVTLTLRAVPAPITPQVVTPILTCDSDNDGLVVVDLLSRETEILNGNTDAVVSYHTDFSDAINGDNPIVAPSNYTMQVSNFSAAGDQILYVRLESTVQLTNEGSPCFDTGALRIINTSPLFLNSTYNYTTCSTGVTSVGTFNFDTITEELSLLNNSQFAGDYTISYHLSEEDVLANNNPLANDFQNTTNPQIVFIRAENSDTGCVATNTIPALVLNVDNHPTISQNLTSLVQCNPNGSPFALFTLFGTTQEVADGRPLTVTFHETLVEAENGENPFSNNIYSNTIPNAQTIYVRAENEIGCYATTSLDLIVENNCLNASYIFDSYICDDDLDGLGCFDLTSRLVEILPGTGISPENVSYHLSREDAFLNTNAIANPETFCTTQVNNEIHLRIEDVAEGEVFGRIFNLNGLVIDPISPTPLQACDADGDGIAAFLLSDKVDEITGGNTGYGVTFYRTEADAMSSVNRLDTVYFNTTPNLQTIYAKVELAQLFQTEVDCYKLVPLDLVTNTAICADVAYEFTEIPHVMYNVNVTPTFNLDDTFSNAKPIPFSFDFFGATYNEFLIGTNGIVSFDISNANNFCEWQIDSSEMLPNLALYTNSIFGVYHDMNNNESGSIGYGIIGEAPFRKMIIFFDGISQFSDGCDDLSSMQIVLYETLNIVDIQVAQKIACNAWNGGLAILGIQDANGIEGYFPSDRNTGVWDAVEEGYRFKPVGMYKDVQIIACDDNENGYFTFDFTTFEDSVLEDISEGMITYFFSETDMLNNSNPLPTTYTNIQNAQVIYARILNSTTNEVTLKTVTLAVIDCEMDTDNDGVPTTDEDVNGDGNLGNDDTDGDGIPDFVDEDDDGDFVLTNVELLGTPGVAPSNLAASNLYLDTDNDNIPNYRDDDDDNDGVPTVDEDYNGNNNPTDDDLNNNNIPDYLDATVALGVIEFETPTIRIYPNPAKSQLTIETEASIRVNSLEIYSVEGRLVSARNRLSIENKLSVDVSNFASGFYILKMRTEGNALITKRFMVE